jgi:hypothetical protein
MTTTASFDEARAHADSIQKAFTAYSTKGWKCLPLDARKKSLTVTNWTDREFAATDFKGLANIGVQLGAVSNNLIDIDLDHPLTRKIAHLFLPPTPWRFGRLYPGESDDIIASHHIYYVEGSTKSSAEWRLSKKETGGKIVKCIEYRGDDSQTAFPPSKHESNVTWVDCTDEPALVTEKDLKMALGVIMTVVWVKHNIAPGIRHDALLRVAGGFAKAGVPIEMARKAMSAISYLTGDEEDNDRDGAIDDTYKKLADGKTISGFASLDAFGWETDRIRTWLPSKHLEHARAADDSKPKVNISKLQPREVVDEVVKILAAVPDESKKLFNFNGTAVIVESRTSKNGMTAAPVAPNDDAFAHHLEGYVQFIQYDKKEKVEIVARTDMSIVRRLKDPSINTLLPNLEAVLRYPIVMQDGKLLSKPGFHTESGFYLTDSIDISLADLKAMTTAQALSNILDVYSDFPFTNVLWGRSISVTALLTAMARKILPLAPMFIATSPYPADGKTVWCQIPQMILTNDANTHALARQDEEQAKQLATYFMNDPDVMVFDNQNGRFKSSALNEIVTTGAFSVRKLGGNELVRLTPKALITLNGINISPNDEISTRSLTLVFNKRHTTEFKYPQLLNHVKKHRRTLILSSLKLLEFGIRMSADERAVVKFEASRFYEWDQMIRTTVIALGLLDPMDPTLRKQYGSLDEQAAQRSEFLTWLIKTFGANRAFSSKETADKIGMNIELQDTIKSLGNGHTSSIVVVGRALGSLRGAELEYSDRHYRFELLATNPSLKMSFVPIV